MVDTIDRVIDKMIQLTGKTNWSRFKARTVENDIVELHEFEDFSIIKNYIESERVEVLYNGKIYSADDFLKIAE